MIGSDIRRGRKLPAGPLASVNSKVDCDCDSFYGTHVSSSILFERRSTKLVDSERQPPYMEDSSEKLPIVKEKSESKREYYATVIALSITVMIFLYWMTDDIRDEVSDLRVRVEKLSGKIDVSSQGFKYIKSNVDKMLLSVEGVGTNVSSVSQKLSNIESKVVSVDSRLTEQVARLAEKIQRITGTDGKVWQISKQVQWYPNSEKLDLIFRSIKKAADGKIEGKRMPIYFHCFPSALEKKDGITMRPIVCDPVLNWQKMKKLK